MATQPTPLQFLASTKNEKTGTALTSSELATRTLHRRAIEAVIWGTPAVNFDLMYQAMVRDAKSGDDSNKIVYWSRLFDWKNQTIHPLPTPMRFTSWLSSIPKTSGQWYSKSHLRTKVRSPARSTIAGKRPSKTSDLPASTRKRRPILNRAARIQRAGSFRYIALQSHTY